MDAESKKRLKEYDEMERRRIQEEFEKDHSQGIRDVEIRVGEETKGQYFKIIDLINKHKEPPFYDYH